jgi:hypothetical protein
MLTVVGEGAARAAAGVTASAATISAFLLMLGTYPRLTVRSPAAALPYEILTAGSGTQSRVRKSQNARPE